MENVYLCIDCEYLCIPATVNPCKRCRSHEKRVKMTYKDAAAMIDRILDEDRHLYTEKAVNALEMGKDALLKLEPTPPTKVRRVPDGTPPLLGDYICPTCGSAACVPCLTDNCPVCGQRLTPYNKNIGDKDGD